MIAEIGTFRSETDTGDTEGESNRIESGRTGQNTERSSCTRLDANGSYSALMKVIETESADSILQEM